MIRLYNIIFNTRDILDIQKDYYAKKWISKEEIIRLFEHEKQFLLKEVIDKETAYNQLLQGFNLATQRSYQHFSK